MPSADVVRNVVPGIHSGAIVAMHDGEVASARLIAEALPGIGDRMHAEHLCSSIDIRPDATGGVFAGTGTHVHEQILIPRAPLAPGRALLSSSADDEETM